MAEARQKEMKVSITVVATKTFMTGLDPSTDVAMLPGVQETAYKVNLLKIAQARLDAAPQEYVGRGTQADSPTFSAWGISVRLVPR